MNLAQGNLASQHFRLYVCYLIDCLRSSISGCDFGLLKMVEIQSFPGRIKTSVVKQGSQGHYLTCLQKRSSTIHSLDKLSHAAADTGGANQ